MSAYGNVVLRYGLAVVFGWFGIDKFVHPEAWLKSVPSYVASVLPASQNVSMYVLGGFEVLIALLLVIGLWTRVVASVGSVFLVGVMIATAPSEIMVRDLGLFAAMLSLVFSGSTRWSVDSLRKKHKDDDLEWKEKEL